MSASMATTGSPWAARCLVNSDDSVVLPLPPLPANAIFIGSPVFRSAPGPGLSVIAVVGNHTGMVFIFM